MKALESRKQLLIAESDLNRAHLIHEVQMLAGDIHALASRATTIGSIASAIAGFVSGLSSLRNKKLAPNAEKPSWGQTLAKAAGLISTLWSTFRSRNE